MSNLAPLFALTQVKECPDRPFVLETRDTIAFSGPVPHRYGGPIA